MTNLRERIAKAVWDDLDRHMCVLHGGQATAGSWDRLCSFEPDAADMYREAADAVLTVLAETHVVIDRARWERVLAFATLMFREEFTDCDAWRNWQNAGMQPGDLDGGA
ncbi:MAG: hypothetical protein IT337_18505 [Thermomicrobiales bacterium]|nr:hypothetical protein [Thermomicrobiales bacterium]